MKGIAKKNIFNCAYRAWLTRKLTKQISANLLTSARNAVASLFGVNAHLAPAYA